jgi:hypothetical protein
LNLPSHSIDKARTNGEMSALELIVPQLLISPSGLGCRYVA